MTITTDFTNTTYSKPCELFQDRTVGSIHCTGSEEHGIKPCVRFKDKKEKEVWFPILKEFIPCVETVDCDRAEQLSLFN